jgi:hypothetical protein
VKSRLAFLAIDLDGDGKITSGQELFGNKTIPGVENGFKALAQIAPHNGDGVIDATDSVYPRLLLWEDSNHNGVSESSEVTSASQRVAKIGLEYREVSRTDEDGNSLRYKGWAELDGKKIKIFDVYFVIRP